jgi:hypothetical protein
MIEIYRFICSLLLLGNMNVSHRMISASLCQIFRCSCKTLFESDVFSILGAGYLAVVLQTLSCLHQPQAILIQHTSLEVAICI